MKIQDQMQRMLDETPEVNLVAFGDLSSGLILNWAAKSACPREVLDLLGAKAAGCFGLMHSGALPAGAASAAFGGSAIHFTQQGSQIFARDPASADDVICAVCEPGAPLEPLLRSAIALADRIAGPG